jgi:hypothetical protein
LLARLSSDKYRQVFAPPTNTEDVQLEATINNFIEHYRTLPLVVRAKLENWVIDRNELRVEGGSDAFRETNALEGRYKAVYRGLDVVVGFYKKGYETLKCHCLHAEISALAQSRHPNIIGFIGASISSDSCVVVTESMACTLDALFLAQQSKKPLWRPTKPQTLEWSLDLVRAVNYMHQSDPAIVHRHLCPPHLEISPTGVLKVAGLGHCRFFSAADRLRAAAAGPRRDAPAFGADLNLDDSEHSEPPPAAAPPAGTAAADDDDAAGARHRWRCYAAPELLRDPAASDPAVDVYSIATLMFFLRAGRDPLPPAGPAPARGDPSAPAPAGRRAAAAGERAWAGVGPPHETGPPSARFAAAAAAAAAARPSADALGWAAFGEAVDAAWAENPARRPSADELTTALELLRRGPARRHRLRTEGCAAS